MQPSRSPVWIASLFVALLAAPVEAANICNETVPANRIVDGIPAYSQCTASTSSAIYSNNGVDTTTTSGGAGWVRTQGSGGYQCTELAHRYLYFRWNVQSVPSGNAGVWCDGTIPNGIVKSTIPMHGDLIVFAPGSCGADATTGHVAVVDVVGSNNTVTFVEQNGASRRSCAISTAACFLHVVANDGSAVDGGVGDAAASDVARVIPDAPLGRDGAADLGERDVRAAGGASGVGGSPASGGASASGGMPGSGGTSGGGGMPGSGGTSGSGGTPGSGGTTTSTPASEPSASKGCACDLGVAGRAGGGVLTLLMLLAGLLTRSRQRSSFKL